MPHRSGRSPFEIVGSIAGVETIATGREIRELARLKKVYGTGRWRKLKGTAAVRLPNGMTIRAEVHWYERHGLGRREIKIKRPLGEQT